MNEDRVLISYAPLNLSTVRCRIDVVDSKLLGKSAELVVKREVVVHDDRPVNKTQTVVKKKIERLDLRTVVDINRADFHVYTYHGEMIHIDISTELTVDDGIIFNSSFTQETKVPFAPRPRAEGGAALVVEPDDQFNTAANLAALHPGQKIGAIVMLALGAFGGAKMYKKSMGRYMTFELHKLPLSIRPQDVIPARKILHGEAQVDLRNVVIRVVAANIEKGQYTRGSGKSRTTKSFEMPVRAVVMYEGFIKHLPTGTPLETVMEGDIDFAKMFTSLYPPQMVGRYHGVDLHWEAQLIHKEFVDQEAIGANIFEWRDFLTEASV